MCVLPCERVSISTLVHDGFHLPSFWAVRLSAGCGRAGWQLPRLDWLLSPCRSQQCSPARPRRQHRHRPGQLAAGEHTQVARVQHSIVSKQNTFSCTSTLAKVFLLKQTLDGSTKYKDKLGSIYSLLPMKSAVTWFATRWRARSFYKCCKCYCYGADDTAAQHSIASRHSPPDFSGILNQMHFLHHSISRGWPQVSINLSDNQSSGAPGKIKNPFIQII